MLVVSFGSISVFLNAPLHNINGPVICYASLFQSVQYHAKGSVEWCPFPGKYANTLTP